jgi:tRNA modification GTPase
MKTTPSPDNQLIFALATHAARSALHLYRVSGPGCWAALSRALRDQHGNHCIFDPALIKARHAYYAHLVDSHGDLIDDVVVTFFGMSASYTGEESAEFSSHGNPLIDAELHQCMRGLGFRDAEPGEFTLRAYFNGRLDLTQVEAIAALVEADTRGALRLARDAAQGTLEKALQPVRQALIDARAELEAHIDFSEDEVGVLSWMKVRELCRTAAENLWELEQSFQRGRRIREGLSVALVGLPNAGKSSLYNALLREDRALVSSEKGTTRDILREPLNIRGRDFVVLDTAGIHETAEHVESMGIAKSLAAAQSVDVTVLVIDSADLDWEKAPWLTALLNNTGRPRESQTLVALSKSDAVGQAAAGRLGSEIATRTGLACVICSKDDIRSLEDALCDCFDRSVGTKGLLENQRSEGAESRAQTPKGLGATLQSLRQRDAVSAARQHAEEAASLADKAAYPEIIASEIISCEEALAELFGRIRIDEVFGKIFSTFCVGK